MEINRMSIRNLLLILSGFICLILLSLTSGMSIETTLFYSNIVLAFVIVGISQFSIFSILIIASNYMLANIYMVYKTGKGYGLLALTHHIYMNEISQIIMLFNVIVLIWVSCTNILKRERTIMSLDLPYNIKTCRIMSLCSVIMAYIAFPGFNFGIQENRFVSLLPGHFWNHFMVIFMLFAFGKIQESKFIKVCFAIVVIWCLIHGERVDAIGMCVFLLLRLCIKNNYRINIKFLARFGIIFVAMFTLLIYVGNSREGTNREFNIYSIASSFLSQGTASDVGYVLNSSVDYVHNNAYLNGSSYITYIQGILPFLDQPMRVGYIILNMYHSAGGEYILIEPYMNFGLWGIIIITNIFIFLLYIFLRRCTIYKAAFYFFLVAASLRYVWYGLTYIETGVLYLLPIVYIIAEIIRKSKTKRRLEPYRI